MTEIIRTYTLQKHVRYIPKTNDVLFFISCFMFILRFRISL